MPNLPPVNSSVQALTGDAVHVWWLDMQALAPLHPGHYAALLSTDEMTQAGLSKQRAQEYIATRLLMRNVLAHYTGIPAPALRLYKDSNGKPQVDNCAIAFNLSHSGNLAVLAVGRQAALGIDIETNRRAHNLTGIAQRYFHREESATLLALDEHARCDYFYRLWTLKEAFFKALGTGIATGLDKACFDLQQPDLQVRFHPALGQQESAWQFHQSHWEHNCHCALAINSNSPVDVAWFSANEIFFAEAFA